MKKLVKLLVAVYEYISFKLYGGKRFAPNETSF